MKILIFSDNVAPYRIGWADELAKNNEVVFAYTKDKDAERNDEWLVKKSKRSQMVKLPATIIKNHAVSLSVVRYIRNHPADIIIFDGYGVVPNMLGMLYMKSKNKNYFINVDGVQTGVIEKIFKRQVKKFLFKPNARFLCGSDYTAEWIKTYGIEDNKIYVHNFSSIYKDDILNDVMSKDEKSALRIKLGIKDKPTIIAVGRFLDWKQFDKLIEAFEPLDEMAQLLLIGEGSEECVYKDIIKQKKLSNVKIIQFLRYEELKNYYMAADLFVLPSNNEVWGLVINEAMCFGLPVIVSNRCVGGLALVENGNNGYIYPFDRGDILRNYLINLVQDETLRIQMGQHSLKIIKDFTIEHMASAHMKVFKEFLSKEGL